MRREPASWDLSELVRDDAGPGFEEQVSRIRKKAKSFGRLKDGLAPEISSAEFGRILRRLERITEEINLVAGYASLQYAADTQSDQATSLVTRMTKLGADISNQVLFFDLWWKRSVDEGNAARLMQDVGDLAGYLRHQRLVSAYTLSEPEEKLINILDATGASALVKIYDKITNAFEYHVMVGGRRRKMAREELAGLVRSANPKTRQAAYAALFERFEEDKGVLGEIYQNIVLNWRDEGIQLRGYRTPVSVRNIANDVDDKTVDSLLRVCEKNAPIFREFFVQKAKMLDLARLRRYDLYAPITARARERSYSYDHSIRLVLESLGRFSPVMSGFAKKVLDQNHVDSSLRPGKRDGAFCSTLSPRVTPFVLVNFTGKLRDVFTLAHELGHAIHSQAAAGRSILVQSASLPLAETASTFSELLLYDSLVEKIPEEEGRFMLAEKIGDLYATIMRQSFFTLFEADAHKQIAASTTVAELSKTYLRNLQKQFGSSVEISDDFALEWSCIPHFYHAPFYCYAYSFGNLLALSLFQRYKKEGADFVPSYLEILSAGGSQKTESLLLQHDMDISSAGFWQDGFEYVRRQVRQLLTMR
jgi:oligoendopeptidase F